MFCILTSPQQSPLTVELPTWLSRQLQKVALTAFGGGLVIKMKQFLEFDPLVYF